MAESKILKKPELKSLNEIFATKDFRIDIPKFQRDYVWETIHWSNLWDDIMDLKNEVTGELFIGFTIGYVSMDGPIQVLNIVDGQQRLITLSILLAVLRRRHDLLDVEKSFILGDLFQQEYQKVKFNKISTHNSEKLFNEIIYGIKNVDKSEATQLERNIYDCFEFYTKKIEESTKSFDDVTKILNVVLTKILFSLTTTDSYENAKNLFQILNSFSMSLGPVDLFKSYLLDVNGAVVDSENEKIADSWNDIKREISSKKIKFEEFLLRFAMSYSGYIKKDNIYDPLKNILQSNFENKPKKFLEALESETDYYLQICTPNDRIINKPTYDEVYFLLRVYSSLNVSEPDVLFYTALREFDKATKNKNVKIRTILMAFLNFTVVRYKLKGDGRAYMHEIYPEWAVKLRELSGKYRDTKDIIPIFKEDKINKMSTLNTSYFSKLNTTSPSLVETEISNLTYSSNEKNKKKYSKDYLLVKYLLALYYFHDDFGEMKKVMSSNGDTYSIEHIEPDSNTTFGEARFSFGNLILVQKDNYGDKPFVEKISLYKQDSVLIKVSDPVLSKNTWTVNDVNERGLLIASIIAKKLAV